MLVLSRDVDESIILRDLAGRVVRVTVVDVRPGNRVRVGIEAPSDVEIIREELLDTWHGRPGFGAKEGR